MPEPSLIHTATGCRRAIRFGLIMIALLILVWLAPDRLSPPQPDRIQETSTLVVDSQDQILRGFTTAQGTWRLPARITDVDPLYLQMLLAYEDQRFPFHPGVDPLAVVRAAGQWLTHGRIVSGASTLTMQTARLLEPHPRTLAGKFGEMRRALHLERHYHKDEILGFYLTLAPYGGNLEGVRMAALTWFGKEPVRLTVAEAALLVALPQSPSRLRPDRFPDRARVARNKVLRRMGQLGVLTAQQVAEADQEPLPQHRRPLPFIAPHLAERLHTAYPATTRHQTFIDRGLQQNLETLARQQQSASEPYNGMAILVVANRERRVLAYVGAGDFFDAGRTGQVDMIRAIRSPGSTLKPLIYGLGFDDLLIHPETLIDDAPTGFGSYRPTNFHHTYAGQLTVREALQHSLNIPAVAVLEQIGPARVAARLREAGLPLHWSAAHPQPGLPLALGGVGMSLEELTTLYVGLANGGRIAPLRFGPADQDEPGRPVLTEVACWYLADILGNAPPPPNVLTPSSAARSRTIAYKTGTSYGFRDAWALGFDPNYTVGVWMGRPDGSPSPGHYGRNTAAPLLFRIFDLLPEATTGPVAPPEGVLRVSREQLPERLRYFRTRPAPDIAGAPTLSITFPITGSTVELPDQNGRWAELPLAANGGVKPLRWLVNGRPLTATIRQQSAFWLPDGEGLARITVLDQSGQSAAAEVWISRGR